MTLEGVARPWQQVTLLRRRTVVSCWDIQVAGPGLGGPGNCLLKWQAACHKKALRCFFIWNSFVLVAKACLQCAKLVRDSWHRRAAHNEQGWVWQGRSISGGGCLCRKMESDSCGVHGLELRARFTIHHCAVSSVETIRAFSQSHP